MIPPFGGTVAPPPARQAISGSIILELWRRSRGVNSFESQISGGSGATVLVGNVDGCGERPRVTCDTCSALGWMSCGSPLSWAVPCEVCDGKGSLSLHAIAEAFDEDPGVLYRLSELRVRPKTALRLLDKLLMLAAGKILPKPGSKQEARLPIPGQERLQFRGACPAGGGNG